VRETNNYSQFRASNQARQSRFLNTQRGIKSSSSSSSSDSNIPSKVKTLNERFTAVANQPTRGFNRGANRGANRGGSTRGNQGARRGRGSTTRRFI